MPSFVNLLTAPSFELPSGTVEVRRNPLYNPGPRTPLLTGWLALSLGTSETVAATWVGTAGAGPEGRTGFHRHTVTTAKTGGASGTFYRSAAGECAGASGDVRTHSLWVKFSVAVVGAQLAVQYRLGAATVGAQATSSAVTVPANTWVRLSHTYAAPGAYDGVQLWAVVPTGAIIPVGGTYDTADALSELGGALLPYLDHTARPVERANLVQNSRGTNPGALAGDVLVPQWYGGAPSAGNTTYITGATDGPEVEPGVRVDSYGRKTWSVIGGGTNEMGWALGSGARPSVTPGTVSTASLYWRKSSAANVGWNQITARYYDAGGVQIGATLTGPASASPAADQWQRVGGTFTAPAGAASVLFAHRIDYPAGQVTVGMTVDATAALVEEAVQVLPYLDGYSPNAVWAGLANASPSYLYDPDLTVVAAGAPFASASVLRGQGISGLGVTGVKAIASTRWAAAGLQSLRLMPSGVTTDTYASVAQVGAGAGRALEIGKTYTMVATSRLGAPQVGPGNGNGTRQVVFIGTGFTAVKSTSAPNAAGVAEHRLTFTVPSTAYAEVRLYDGQAMGGGDVWWDDLALVEGVYTGPAFNGDTPDVAPWRQWWAGTPHASTSYRSEMTIVATPQPSSGSVRLELTGGEPGTPLYVLRRGNGSGTGMVRETSEGTVVWPPLGETITLTDYEATQGTSVMYIVTDADGAPVATVNVAIPLWGTWLKSPGRPFRNTRVRYVTDTGIKLEARRLIVNVEGSPQRVVFAQNRANPTATVTLLTLTRAEADALQRLVSDGMTLMLDTPPTWGVPFRFISVGDIQPERAYDFAGLNLAAEARAWILGEVVEVEAPQGVPVGDPGRTYADLPSLFSSYVAIPATTDTYERLGTGEE